MTAILAKIIITDAVTAALPVQTAPGIAHAAVFGVCSNRTCPLVPSADPEGWLLSLCTELSASAIGNTDWGVGCASLGSIRTLTDPLGSYCRDRAALLRTLSTRGVVASVTDERGATTLCPLDALDALQGINWYACQLQHLPPDAELGALIAPTLCRVWLAGTEVYDGDVRTDETVTTCIGWRQRLRALEIAQASTLGWHVLQVLPIQPTVDDLSGARKRNTGCVIGAPCDACRAHGCGHPRWHPMHLPPDQRQAGCSRRLWDMMLQFWRWRAGGWAQPECRACRGEAQLSQRPGDVPTELPKRRRRRPDAAGQTQQQIAAFYNCVQP